MNRRQFLTYTVALAVAAPFAKMITVADTGAMIPTPPAQPDPRVWVPTQTEVDEWLEYYKLSVWNGHRSLAHLMGNQAFSIQSYDEFPSIAGSKEEVELFEAAERAFRQLEHDRNAVSVSQGVGYDAGREGLPRFNALYTAPSNEAFGWYNYWAVGNADRLRRRA